MEAHRTPHPPLTAREIQVLQIAANGDSVCEIAEALIVSPATVRSHLGSIYGKLGAKSRTAAVAIAMREGLIS